MMTRKTYHVTYDHERSGWKVLLQGAQRASGHLDTKQQAVERARELAKKPGLGQVVIHKMNGLFQREHTYGSDPRRHKG